MSTPTAPQDSRNNNDNISSPVVEPYTLTTTIREQQQPHAMSSLGPRSGFFGTRARNAYVLISLTTSRECDVLQLFIPCTPRAVVFQLCHKYRRLVERRINCYRSETSANSTSTRSAFSHLHLHSYSHSNLSAPPYLNQPNCPSIFTYPLTYICPTPIHHLQDHFRILDLSIS